jgi:L-ascorbate metabolism protein UlaG (beta-lactamase superfamily)
MPAGNSTDRSISNRLVFLGHSTVLVDIAGTRLLTDPVLGHVLWSLRRRAAVVSGAHLADVDAVFISHGHFDHLDLPSLRALPGRPQVIVPAGLGSIAKRADLGPVHEVRAGDRLQVGGVEIEIVQAVHGGRRSPWAAGDAIGCLISAPAPAASPAAAPAASTSSAASTVYFAGDTDLFPAMEEMAGRVDVALLPVGGWGPRLGRGHLDPRRAAEAAALIKPTVAVPIHWGTLSPIWLHRLMGKRFDAPGPAFAEAIARYAPLVHVHVLAPGASIDLPDRDAAAA